MNFYKGTKLLEKVVIWEVRKGAKSIETLNHIRGTTIPGSQAECSNLLESSTDISVQEYASRPASSAPSLYCSTSSAKIELTRVEKQFFERSIKEKEKKLKEAEERENKLTSYFKTQEKKKTELEKKLKETEATYKKKINSMLQQQPKPSVTTTSYDNNKNNNNKPPLDTATIASVVSAKMSELFPMLHQNSMSVSSSLFKRTYAESNCGDPRPQISLTTTEDKEEKRRVNLRSERISESDIARNRTVEDAETNHRWSMETETINYDRIQGQQTLNHQQAIKSQQMSHQMNSSLQQQTHQELMESRHVKIKEKGMDHEFDIALKEVEIKGRINEAERVAKVEADKDVRMAEIQAKIEIEKAKLEIEKIKIAQAMEIEKFKLLNNSGNI
jgi:hypothetical protein